MLSTTENIPATSLLGLYHETEAYSAFLTCPKTNIRQQTYPYKYKKLAFRKRTMGGGKINKTW
jgi:hypothetical protein